MNSEQWTVDNGKWKMENEQWTVENGQWTMDNEQKLTAKILNLSLNLSLN